MRLLTALVSAAALVLLAPPGAAQTEPSAVYDHTRAPTLVALRTTQGMQVDGRLDEAVWAQATPATEFFQRDPDEGQPVSERTEVRVLIDEGSLYIGARFYDSDPKGIRARLARRDAQSESDAFTVWLDSYHDHLTAFRFDVNAAGSVRDASVGTDGGEDFSWDPVWQAAAQVDAEGWSAEMRIPLDQIRFNSQPDAVWGIQLARFIHRKQEWASFAFTRKSEEGGVSRFGHLTGLGRVHYRPRLELLPYAAARAQYTGVAPGNPFRDGDDYFGAAGVDLKYGVSSDLTLNATINPDFGQAEVDPAVVNLSAFETFFDEKRPFFIEGSRYFSFGSLRAMNRFGFGQLFYSRRIGAAPHRRLTGDLAYVDAPDQTTIAAAAKLTGQTRSGWRIGLLDAVTARERARYETLLGDHGKDVVEPPANYFVGRARRDFRSGNTSVGGLFTSVHRDLDHEALESTMRSQAYLAGLDFNHAWAGRSWALDGYYAQSLIRGSEDAIARAQRSSARYFQRPDADHVEFDPTRTSLTGYQSALSLAKTNGEHWVGSVALQAMSPGFEVNDLGFATRSDRYTFASIVIYNQNKPGKLLRRYSMFPFNYHAWNYSGDPITAGYSFVANGLFTNYWSFDSQVTYQASVFSDQLTRGGPQTRTPATGEAFFGLNSDSRKPYQLSLSTFHSWNDAGGGTEQYSTSVSFRPSPALQVSVGPEFTQSRNAAQYVAAIPDPEATETFDRRYVFATLDQSTLALVSRINWVFSPKVSLQLYAQPLISSGDFSEFKELHARRTFDFDVYGVHRGTIARDADGVYTVDPDGAGPASSFAFGDPNFNFRSLRGNAVLRWEYRPGSTIFLIWQQVRTGIGPEGDFQFSRDFSALGDARPDNLFMAKITTWIGI